MKMTGFGFFALSLCAGTYVVAHTGVANPAVMARMEIMTSSKQSIKHLVAMANGTVPFDANQAEDARQNLIDTLQSTPRMFREPHDDPQSNALPAIWLDWARFEAINAEALGAAEGLRTNSVDLLRTDLANLGAKCISCHQSFRREVE